MKVVWSWLKDYVDLDGVAVADMAERWTVGGLEVDGMELIGDWWDPRLIVVGAVTRVEPHPEADRLCLAWVDWGAGEAHRCVTGAPNLFSLKEQGELESPLKVAFAREGAELEDAYSEEPRRIMLKGREVRGIMSDAMVCSERELGLSDDHDGILILEGDAQPGTPLVDVLGDAVITLDLTANYAYAANMVGLARESAAMLGRPYQPPTVPPVDGTGDVGELVQVAIARPELCARYIARVIRGLNVGPSPRWMQRRLQLSGMRPISNIVDVTNYVMLEWGEPLHAFDYDVLRERAGGERPTITVRPARDGERITTLDDVDRKLDGDTLVIADGVGPVAIAGVMGGAATEVGPDTKAVLLEAAAFEFVSVRRATQRFALPSESAWRFGRDVPPALAEMGSERAAGLLAALAGGSVVGGVVDAFPAPRERTRITMPVAEFKRLLGVQIPEPDIKSILERLDFDVSLQGGTLNGTPSELRVDQRLPADIIEEVARIWGYDRLPSRNLSDQLPLQRDNPRLMQEEAVRDALTAVGLQEIITYRLTSPEHEARLDGGGSTTAIAPTYVTLSNPPSPERRALRRSILTGLLDAASANRRFRDRLALYEIGAVFQPRDGQHLPDEPRRAGLVLLGPADEPHWRIDGDPRALDFYDAKGAVEALLEALGVDATFSAGQHHAMHPGRTAAVHAAPKNDRSGSGGRGSAGQGIPMGHVGELHPVVRARWNLGDMPVAVAELDLDALAEVGGAVRPFVPFSSYPAVERDLAVVVAEDVAAGDVECLVRQAGGPLLVACQLFDVYRGSQLGANRKSLAFNLRFQAPDKTLEGKAVDGMRQRIVAALEKGVGAEIR